MSSEKTEVPKPVAPVNRIAGQTDANSFPTLVDKAELKRITDAADELEKLRQESGPAGDIYRAAIDMIENNLAIGNPRIIQNLVGNATTLSSHYTSDGLTGRKSIAEAIELLEDSLEKGHATTAELLKITEQEAATLLTNPPKGMIGYFNRYWADSYNQLSADKSHIPLFTLPNGHQVDVLTIHRALSSEISNLTAKKGISMLRQRQQEVGDVPVTPQPEEAKPVNVTPNVQTPLALLLQGLKPGGRLFEKAADKARELGVTDDGAVYDIAGNAVGPLTLMATIVERSPGDSGMLVDMVNSQVNDCDDKKRTALKKVAVRGIKPDADFPEGAVAFYNECYTGRHEGKMNSAMMTGDNGAELHGIDVKQALTHEAERVVAEEARRMLSVLDKDGFGAAFNSGMKRAG